MILTSASRRPVSSAASRSIGSPRKNDPRALRQAPRPQEPNNAGRTSEHEAPESHAERCSPKVPLPDQAALPDQAPLRRTPDDAITRRPIP